MPSRRLTLLCLSVLFASSAFAQDSKPADSSSTYARRWFYASHNLLVDKNVEALVALIERAGAAGYNGLMLADYKFNILERMPERYFKNVARVKAAAAKAGVEIIPAIFPIGYSSGLLAHDPNLAEGLPVKDAPFVVKGNLAVPVQQEKPFRNGDLEEFKGDRFIGYSFQDDIGKTTFVDRETVKVGKASCRMEDPAGGTVGGNCRISQRVKLRPWSCWRLSAWVKTQDLAPSGGFRLMAMGVGEKGRTLSFYEGHLKSTQDWQHIDVVFNSLDFSEVQIYGGLWGGKKGRLWIDGIELEEMTLVNVLRRAGCPFTVKSDDGATTYEEGKDFEPVRDPKLGMDPYAGEFRFNHAGPPIRLTAGSRIADGQKLKVSWHHPVIVHGFQVMCCISEAKTYDLLRDQAKRVNELFAPKAFFMSHDEIRVGNWCKACRDRAITPGTQLADNVKRCVSILRDLASKAEIVVWNDMFDPTHNAKGDRYYLVDGDLAGSWEGLDKSVIIANWNGGKAAASLKWFADRGHRQIMAGYYDVNDLSGFTRWDTAARGVPGVIGFMYTTWDNKYGLLEEYGKAMGKRGE